MNKRRGWIIATVIWMTVIFCFTQLPYFTGKKTGEVIHKVVIKEHQSIDTPLTNDGENEDINFIIRKATHVTVFGILALLLFKSLEGKRFSYLLAWVCTFFYAMTDEYHQSFMPGRGPSFRDVLIDGTGALLALLIIYFIKSKREPRSELR